MDVSSVNLLKIPGLIILLPAFLLILGVMLKGLAKKDGLKFKDFYLGAELALAAMTSTLVYACDLARRLESFQKNNPTKPLPAKDVLHMGNAVSFAFITLMAFLVLLIWHQQFERKDQLETKKAKFCVGFLINIIGLATLVGFQILFDLD